MTEQLPGGSTDAGDEELFSKPSEQYLRAMLYAQFLNATSSDTCAELEALLQIASAGAPLFISASIDLAHLFSFTPWNRASADGGWIIEAASNNIGPVMATIFFMQKGCCLDL